MQLTPFWPGKCNQAVLELKSQSDSEEQFQTKPFSLEQLSTTVLATQLKKEVTVLFSFAEGFDKHCNY